ncbi:unnamed protein product [Soboliphyme baturini]|uniref:G_PROTEIN_RECEP_F1_2 domain-containing protein n=1 Tax=Soboliphyme baturini TaxID=241478 RepID=A0A183IDT6_9BILA|nr:unnamed protein product [Soboliphyme baturini]
MNASEERIANHCDPKRLWNLIVNSQENTSTVTLPSGYIFNKSEVSNLYYAYVISQKLDIVALPILEIVLAVFGILGSVCILITITHQCYSQRLTFKSFMVALSTSDLVFNVFAMPFVSLSRFTTFSGTPHAAISYTVLVTMCIVNVASLFSDLTSLCMMFERYVSLMKPFYWHSRNRQWKKWFCITALLLNACMSTFRLYSPLKYRIEATGGTSTKVPLYYVTFSDFRGTLWHRVLGLICDIVLPLTILVAMLYFSLQTVTVVKKRKKILPSRIAVQKSFIEGGVVCPPTSSLTTFSISNVDQPEKTKELDSINMLIFCTAALTIICEVAYTYLWFLNLSLGDEVSMNDCMNKDLTRFKLIKHVLNRYSAAVTNFVEFVTRACNFYNYLTFSAVFRSQFVERMNSLKIMISNKCLY